MKRRAAFHGVLLVLALGVAGPAAGATVGVLSSSGDPVYADTRAGLRTALAAGTDVVAREVGGAGFPAGTDVVVAVGTEALSTALQTRPRTPLLAVLVPRATVDALRSAGLEREAPFAALYLGQPIERQIRVARRLFPPLKRVGAVLAPGSEAADFASPGAALDGLVIERWAPDEPPLRAIARLSGGVDAIIGLPDTRIYNSRSIHGILLASYRANVPLIGYSRAVVRAGALTSAWLGPRDHGREAGEMLAPYLRSGGATDWPASRYSRRFRITVNERVARSLGLRPGPHPEGSLFREGEPIE